MSAHESMEHAEHAEHASGSNKKIALLIAVIALFLALSETLGKGAPDRSHQQECRGLEPVGVLPGQEHPPHRGAGGRRITPSSASASIGDDAAKAALQKQIDDWNKTAARYRSEPETGEGSEQLVQARQARRARARRGDGEVSPLRSRLRGLSDRHRAGVRDHHHRHNRRWRGYQASLALIGHRLYRARPVRAAVRHLM